MYAISIFKGDLKVVQYLIEKGAKIEAENKNKETPLHLASFCGKKEVVKYLVAKGANKNAKDQYGNTPSVFAQNDEIREILK